MRDHCGMCMRYFSISPCSDWNANASHVHAISVVLNQVHGASSLATFKGDYMYGNWQRTAYPLGHGSFYALAFPVALCQRIGSVAA